MYVISSFDHYQNKYTGVNYLTKKDNKIQTNSEKDQYKNMNFYPFSTKEWGTSSYSYNKSSSKSLVANNYLLNILLKSYLNMLQVKRVVLNRRRNNKLRYSANKIYTSRAELQHTNSKLFITLYTYNKKKSSFENYIRNLITLIKFRKIVVGKKKVYIPNHKNRSLHLLKKIFSISKKWNIAFFKEKE